MSLSFVDTYIIRALRYVSCPFSGNFPMISDDLVNSYHLLLCALDLTFTNALLCNARKELLNPNFKGINIKNLWFWIASGSITESTL